MNPIMKKRFRLLFLGLSILGCLFFTSGCDNTTVGVGFSGYDYSSGMSYGYGVSSGPYGTHGSSYVGYSSGGYYGRGYGGGYYGRPYGRW
jgi:predicted small secreted protein